jgi:hypothetical protein
MKVMRETSTIQEQNALSTLCMYTAQSCDEFLAQHTVFCRVLHKVDTRRLPAAYSLMQIVTVNIPQLHPHERLCRRGGTAHYQTSLLYSATVRRHLSSVIAGV